MKSLYDLLTEIEKQYSKPLETKIHVGDIVLVKIQIPEEELDSTQKKSVKQRVQKYEGLVVSKQGKGNNETITVRRRGKGGIEIESIFLTKSPINIIEIIDPYC